MCFPLLKASILQILKGKELPGSWTDSTCLNAVLHPTKQHIFEGAPPPAAKKQTSICFPSSVVTLILFDASWQVDALHLVAQPSRARDTACVYFFKMLMPLLPAKYSLDGFSNNEDIHKQKNIKINIRKSEVVQPNIEIQGRR